MRRFLLLGRFLLARSSGVQALRRGLPLYLAIGIVATILFARQGLDARTVVHGASQSFFLRVVLLFTWVAAAFPVVRAIVVAPDHAFLRVLPVPRWQIVVWLALLLLVAELPWTLLWTRGGGPLAGTAATLTALALHAALLRSSRSKIDGAARFSEFGTFLTAYFWLGPKGESSAIDWAIRAVLAFTACFLSLPLAWRLAPERNLSGSGGRIVGTPRRALARAYLRVLERRHGAALIRAVVVIVVLMGWTGLALSNDATLAEHATRTVLAAWVPACVSAAAVPAGPILRTEIGAEWVLASAGMPLGTRRLAHVALLATIGSGAGFVVAVMLSFSLAWSFTSWWGLALAMTLSGALLAGSTAFAMRWALRETGQDGARAVGAVVALIAFAEAVLYWT